MRPEEQQRRNMRKYWKAKLSLDFYDKGKTPTSEVINDIKNRGLDYENMWDAILKRSACCEYIKQDLLTEIPLDLGESLNKWISINKFQLVAEDWEDCLDTVLFEFRLVYDRLIQNKAKNNISEKESRFLEVIGIILNKSIEDDLAKLKAKIKQEEDDDDDDDEYDFGENVDFNEVEYSVYDGEASASMIWNEKIRHLIIPEKIKDEDDNEYIVTNICISDFEKVTHLTLPRTITSISGFAFERGANIRVDFSGPASVIFENGIFYSKDKKVLQNSKLAAIGEEYTVVDGVEEIARDAFEGCDNLRVLNIPSSIKKISPAFADCDQLEEVNIYAEKSAVKFDRYNSDDEEVDIFEPNVKVNFVSKTKPQPIQMNMTKFALSVTDKKLAGVCGGIAEGLGINSWIVRILFVVLSLFSFGALLYILLWVVMPKANK